jgi:hypothetical protein
MLTTDCPGLELVARGKVRDIYALPEQDDRLLFVATDRISAYDVILDSVRPVSTCCRSSVLETAVKEAPWLAVAGFVV